MKQLKDNQIKFLDHLNDSENLEIPFNLASDVFLLFDFNLLIKSITDKYIMKGIHNPIKYSLSLSDNSSYEILFKKGSDIRNDWIILQSMCLIKQVILRPDLYIYNFIIKLNFIF